MLRLKEIRNECGKTQTEIASFLNISRAAYTNIENGRRDPDTQTLLALSEYFDVSLDALFGKEAKSTELLPDEKQLVMDYRNLNEHGRKYIKQQMFIALSIYKNSSDLSNLESEKIV